MNVIAHFREKVGGLVDLMTSRRKPQIVDNYSGNPILDNTEGNRLISRVMDRPGPAMIARLGRVEVACLMNYLERKENGKTTYGKSVKQMISMNAGFFPPTDEMLDRFSAQFLDQLRDVDVLAVWFIDHEDFLSHEYCRNAHLVMNRSLEPYYHEKPWSAALRNKTVLVIHPYQESIRSQFAENRERLFGNPDILPPFHLETIKAVQSVVGNKTPFGNWFEAYEHMCSEMEKKDFDIAIIGAGAYGLPLACHAKKLGKKAIQMGGGTQILFGIKGKRWDSHDVISKMYNEYWVRPSEDERPANYKAVEGGCYW